MGQIDCPETSVRSYHYSLRNNPDEGSSQNQDKLGENVCVLWNYRRHPFFEMFKINYAEQCNYLLLFHSWECTVQF